MEIYHPRDEELIREMRRVRRSDRRKRLAWGLSILLILSISAGLFVFHRYYQLVVMHGPAMGATLPEGAVVLLRKSDARQTYESGDIILYEKRIARENPGENASISFTGRKEPPGSIIPQRTGTLPGIRRKKTRTCS